MIGRASRQALALHQLLMPTDTGKGRRQHKRIGAPLHFVKISTRASMVAGLGPALGVFLHPTDKLKHLYNDEWEDKTKAFEKCLYQFPPEIQHGLTGYLTRASVLGNQRLAL
jgi:hypothetical protein